jgi:threonine dehydratase
MMCTAIAFRYLPRLTLSDVFAARRSIAALALRTPVIRSENLSARLRHDILLKLETLQPTGAFKIRGAANALAQRPRELRIGGVVCASTGNHGRAVAHAARQLGIQATICLSALVPQTKVKAIEALGAGVRRIGRSQDEAMVEVARLVAEEGMIEVPPFDDPAIIAGQGTIGLELMEDVPELDTIVVPLSGGGLAGGIAFAAKAINPGLRVIGVSMDRGAAMQASLAAGRPVAVEELPSLADSLGGGIGGGNRWTFDLCRRLLDDVVLVSEAEIYRGMAHLLHEERIVAEGAAAVGVAGLLSGKIAPRGPTALIVSGRNVDMDQLIAVASGHPVRLGDREVCG